MLMASPSFFFFLLIAYSEISLSFGEPNPPTWPSGVYVFDPSTPNETQAIVDQAFATNGGHDPPFNGQFSEDRYAFLFKPGYHDVQVNVGFYTHVMGLGSTPKTTQIYDVACENGDFDYSGGALDNFWRAAENFYIKPARFWNGESAPAMLWAVSQASPLRRLYVEGNLDLWEYNYGCCAGYASGGYLSNSVITGQISSGSQQQWITRNTQMGSFLPGGWNLVFVGCSGNVPSHSCPDSPSSGVDATPKIAEKPYITIDPDSGKFYLMVPPVETNKQGPSTFSKNVDTPVDFESVFVASPSDSVSTINSKIASGLHVVFAPGIYSYSTPIVVNTANTVILGIGFPTFISTAGQECFQVGNVDGVRIAGLLLQAGPVSTPTLLRWGGATGGVFQGNPSNPGVMSDLWARVGGPNDQNIQQVTADRMVLINSSNVIIDRTWLWRADHSISGEVYNGDNPCQVGIEVNGDSVVAYGLAVEHTLEDLVRWNGENGQVFYYQSEYPYDVNTSYADEGYVSYRVNPTVTRHNATGVGAYCYFRDYPVTVDSGFIAPNVEGVQFKTAFTTFLNGGGGIEHVLNNAGAPVQGSFSLSYVC
eukprot:CAMPEP_0201492408 /NCGR_PEP_ID=MMETSP0151_2-20130828/32987_1 /ASSEMBLY_ACC=CAM_ASM_000257 /TAXON_ID=200890 /ORGANISM="Paramoeba atlantica, Strain 621/1 / CCAP 1560/9" /LENGTH=591 /DNA_ID=CAMNT_0047879201 /DNA_START=82 /DNA_END=1857 /DNA_ORIENTATION=-